MRFQGEICTLSFGLNFDKEEVLLSGTLWPRRPPSHEARTQPLRIHFSTLFTEFELISIQDWLTLNDAATPLLLTGNVRQISRATGSDPNIIYLDLEFAFDQIPPWWDWSTSFPLCARLEVRASEFTYLTESMSRERWSADLTW